MLVRIFVMLLLAMSSAVWAVTPRIVAGGSTTSVLEQDSTAWGVGSIAGYWPGALQPTRLFPAINDAIQINTDGSDYVLRSNGELWAVGNNNNGMIGDGYDDIVLRPWGKNALPMIYINDGTGNFALVDTSKFPMPPDAFRATSPIYADIDGDGIRDLIYWPLTGVDGSSSTIQYQILKGQRNINQSTDLK